MSIAVDVGPLGIFADPVKPQPIVLFMDEIQLTGCYPKTWQNTQKHPNTSFQGVGRSLSIKNIHVFFGIDVAY